MKPVNPIKNQYRGINAHLHSFWQGTNLDKLAEPLPVGDLSLKDSLARLQGLGGGYILKPPAEEFAGDN